MIDVKKLSREMWTLLQFQSLSIGDVLVREKEKTGSNLVFILQGKLAYFQKKSVEALREEKDVVESIIELTSEIANVKLHPYS